ncbi:discoidin domain-containing protein [Sphingopyxis sp. JAI128]|uniref:discoidin domain-containing protein n=1 Tax=Sphingopyxis sp. JAI128 TaxID=2723066 RepID=UPI00390C45DA
MISPASYSASSTYGGYTGLVGNGSAMHDEAYAGATSVHGTAAGDYTPWIQMDFGSERSVGSGVVAPISTAYGNWGPSYLNGAVLQRSTDGASWTTVTTVSGAADEVRTAIVVNATARFIRLTKSNRWLAVGDFYALQ